MTQVPSAHLYAPNSMVMKKTARVGDFSVVGEATLDTLKVSLSEVLR